jgi:hypothetical protein
MAGARQPDRRYVLPRSGIASHVHLRGPAHRLAERSRNNNALYRHKRGVRLVSRSQANGFWRKIRQRQLKVVPPLLDGLDVPMTSGAIDLFEAPECFIAIIEKIELVIAK